MRKFAILLLLSIALTTLARGQTIDYFPKSASQPVGFVLVKPTTINPAVDYPWAIFMHGTGGRGDGSLENWGLPVLINNGELPINLRDAAEKFGFYVLAPQISGDWQVSDVESMITWAKSNLRIDIRRSMITGLSLGGGGVLRYITSSATNAEKFAVAVPICPVAWGTNWSSIVTAKLPVWFFHAANDATVNVSSTNNAVNSINNLNPQIKAEKSIYKSGGHSIWGFAYEEQFPPATPATADFLNNPAENIYQWFLRNRTDSPLKILTAVALPPIADIGSDRTVTTRSFSVDASASQNVVPYPAVYDAYTWDVAPITGSWNNLILNPAGIYGGAVKSFSVSADGTYKIKVTVKGNNGSTAYDEIIVTVNSGGTPPPTQKKELGRIFVPVLNKFIVVYDDGSTQNL